MLRNSRVDERAKGGGLGACTIVATGALGGVVVGNAVAVVVDTMVEVVVVAGIGFVFFFRWFVRAIRW